MDCSLWEWNKDSLEGLQKLVWYSRNCENQILPSSYIKASFIGVSERILKNLKEGDDQKGSSQEEQGIRFFLFQA